MTIEAGTLVEDEALTLPDDKAYLHWTPVVAGAFAAAAFSFILVMFGVTIGLGVSSTSPTWRDASAALSLLSGLYLILQAIVSFGIGGYIAGHLRRRYDVAGTPEAETRDGFHGLAAWALAVLLGAALTAVIGAATVHGSSSALTAKDTTSAEPLLSYELDRLFRAPRPTTNVAMGAERAEAGRILMTSSSHNGVNGDDRTHLIQQVATTTGLSAGDAERRVDQAIAASRTAIAHSRRSTIILAFSIAAATLLGAVSAWAAAASGDRMGTWQ
ncbi:hypothetical protein [Bradyrhizobium sp. ARR65]|uniref:hypothetical protein n=1 Tax=Bradyrhizobium sp. ARR65 TaxID=1040989 RepID=UPI0004649E4C|nr:hypothetical protein [Bradyrhizobium sp. ARR65]